MATRLVHPIRSSGRRGWRGPVSDAEGPCPIRSWPVDGAGRGWDPRSTAGAGFGILADLILADPARGVRGVRPQLNPTRITRLPSCSRASTPSMPMRLSDRGHGHGWSTVRRSRTATAKQPPRAQVAPPGGARTASGWCDRGVPSGCELVEFRGGGGGGGDKHGHGHTLRPPGARGSQGLGQGPIPPLSAGVHPKLSHIISSGVVRHTTVRHTNLCSRLHGHGHGSVFRFTLSDMQAPLEAVQAQSRRRVGVRSSGTSYSGNRATRTRPRPSGSHVRDKRDSMSRTSGRSNRLPR